MTPPDTRNNPDEMAPSRGICTGLELAALLWLALALVVWAWLRWTGGAA